MRRGAGAVRSRTRQWSRTAFALAALFASFPLVARVLLGVWTFEGATGIAGMWLAIGIYLHIRSRRVKPAPDPAAMLDDAIHLFAAGETDRALSVLDRAILESPWLWQAYQRRGELRLQTGAIAAALDDFNEALRLAPDEPHLHMLRSQAESLLREI